VSNVVSTLVRTLANLDSNPAVKGTEETKSIKNNGACNFSIGGEVWFL